MISDLLGRLIAWAERKPLYERSPFEAVEPEAVAVNRCPRCGTLRRPGGDRCQVCGERSVLPEILACVAVLAAVAAIVVPTLAFTHDVRCEPADPCWTLTTDHRSSPATRP